LSLDINYFSKGSWVDIGNISSLFSIWTRDEIWLHFMDIWRKVFALVWWEHKTFAIASCSTVIHHSLAMTRNGHISNCVVFFPLYANIFPHFSHKNSYDIAVKSGNCPPQNGKNWKGHRKYGEVIKIYICFAFWVSFEVRCFPIFL